MRILIISYSDNIGGASIAARRMWEAVNASSSFHEVVIYVNKKKLENSDIQTDESFMSKVISKLNYYIDRVPLKVYSRYKDFNFSTGFGGRSLNSVINKFEPDVINVHWINNGFFNISSFKYLKIPLVLTLHDMWAFTGGCHYDDFCGRFTSQCGQCPILDSRKEKDLSRFLFERKKTIFEKCLPEIITPSTWLGKEVQNSEILKNCNVNVIYNGINLNVFYPRNKIKAKEKYGLELDRVVLLFGAIDATNDKRKGFKYLQKALVKLKNREKYQIAIFGSKEKRDGELYGIATKFLGQISNEKELSFLYSAADIFIAPSLQDNLPNALVESIACGTPVVSFNTGGIPDIIEHRNEGYLAELYDSGGLVEGIYYVNDNNLNGEMSENCRKKAEDKFSMEAQAKAYMDIFLNIQRKSIK